MQDFGGGAYNSFVVYLDKSLEKERKMNKIYKVVWSKAAEAYVVTSELAKSCTKSPSGKGLRRSVTAALLAAIAVAPVSFGVYAADDTHYVSVNSDNQTADSNYDNQGAQAKNSIAIGPSVKTTGEDNIIIGSGEIVSEDKKDGTSFDGTRVLVVGHGNYFQPTSEWDDNTKGKSISYRDVAIIGHSNKLLQGNKADAGKGHPTHQLVHGWENTLNGSYTGAIGYENEIKNNSRPGFTSHHMAFAIGSANTIDATGYYMGDKNRINTLPDYTEPSHPDETFGADLYVIGRHNIVGSNKDKDSYVNKGRIIGSENVVYCNDVNVFGKSNKAYGSSALVVGTVNRVGVDEEGNLITTDEGGELTSPVAVGVNNVVTAPYGVAVGAEARAEGYRATAVGSLAVAPNERSTAMGSENRATGYSSVAVGTYNNSYDFDTETRKSYDSGMYSSAIGVMNISTAEASSAIGAKNTASGKQSSSFGYRNTAAGMNSSAVGYYNKAQGDKTSALGYFNQVTGKQSSAVGMQNYLTVAGSTAIGNYNNTWNVPEKKWEYQTAGAESAAIGIKNHSAGNYSSALGSQNKSGGTASSAVGYRNITDGDLADALGYANQATAKYSSAVGALNQAEGQYSSAVGNQNQAEGKRSQAVGYRNFVSGYGAVALGSENNLNFVKQYQALGFVKTGDLSSALGISNTTAGRKSMGIGSGNYAFGTKSAGIGMNNYSMGYETLAIGHYAVAGSEDPSKIDQVKYAAAIGNRAKSTITDAVAIGSFSNTTRDKGDYGYNPVLEKAVTDTDITDDANIGTYRTELENARAEWQTSMEKAEELLHKIHTQQYADEAEYQQWSAEYDRLNADADAKMAAYDAAQKKVSDLVGAWQGQMAALSVGDEATGRTRQITGVAAGSADTDAVNVAQLKVLGGKVTANSNDIATLQEGWTLQDANTTVGKKVVKAKDTVKVTGDEYITATVDKDGLTLGMDETKLNSQINNQIDNSKTVQAKMTSWVLKAATTDKDPAAKGQTIDNTNNVATFGVEKDDQGLTVARDGATIKYGIDGSKIDLAGNTSITNLNNKIEKSKIHYFSVKSDDSANPADTNWNNDGATGENAIAIGKDAKAKTKASVVVGLNASSGDAANDGVAVGSSASVTGFSGVAIGRESSAEGQETVAIGTGAKGVIHQTVAIGGYANAGGFGAVSIGRSSSSKERGVALGNRSFSNYRGVAVGETSIAEAPYAVAVGDQTASYAMGAVTLGNKTRAFGDSSVAIGNQARVSGKGITPEEYEALPEADQKLYRLYEAVYYNYDDPSKPIVDRKYFKVIDAQDWRAEKHYNSIAIGTTSFVEAKEAIGIGAATRIHGDRGVALGYAAVSEENGTALGAGAQAKANAGVALGEGAVADTAAEVAGYDPKTGKASTETTPTWKSVKGAVSVGTADKTRQITNLAAGLADTDAVNVAQLKVVNAKADKNATDITNLTKTVNANGKATKVMVDGQEDRTDGNLKIKKTDTDGQLTYDLSLNDEIYLGKAGEDGKDGKDGKIGLTGKDGTSAEIRIGQGKPGVDGKDGETTTRIIYKDKDGNDHEVATFDDGLKFKGDNDTIVTRKLNEQLNITGGITDAKELSDNNIGVVGTQDGGMAVKLSKKLKGLTSAEFVDGNKVTNITGQTITQKDGDNVTNITAGDVTVTKKEGNETKTLSIWDLNDTVNANGKATKVMVDGQEDRTDGNLKIKKTDTDGQLTYDLSLNDEIYLGKAGEDGKDGKDGKIGLTGKDGTSAEIRIGQGKPGVDGKDGETTTRIIYKDKDGNDHEVATFDDGLKFKGDNDTIVTRKLNEQLNITGGITDAKELSDNNIGVVGTQDGGMAVKLSKKLKGLTSAEFKDGDNITNITAGDVTVTKKEGNETKTLSIWELNKTVNNITAGTTDVSSWKLQANGKDERIIKKNSVVNFTNGTATEVTVHENNITVDLNKATKEKIDKIDNIDGRVTTIENNIKNIDQKIEGAKITVEGDTTTGVKAEEVKDKNDKVKGYKVSLDKQVKVGNVAIDGKDSKGEITGLTNTTVDATDFATKGRAATEEQLKAAMGKVQAQGRTTVKGSGNITVTPGTTGAAEYTVGLADNISVDSVTANEYKVGDKTYINKDGINANGNKITNVADGKVSADSKDAVNGSQLFGVEQKVNQNISILGGKVSELDGRVNRVGAGAAALAALHPLDFDPDDKWDFAAGYGNYSGANAVAIGAYYRPNEDTMFSVGGSFGGGENMVNAGVSVKLGQGNHVSTSRVAMAKDMLDMQQRMAEMEAQMAKLQGFIGALTGADAQAAMFPDVPENHWAYEYVDGLREQGIIEGYPDGNFAGDRSMTRYEIAAMLYRALSKGVSLDARAVKEFAPELARIRVDVVTKDKEGQPVIERVRVNEEQQAK